MSGSRKVFAIRVNDGELEAIKNQAKRSGMKAGAYVRHVALANTELCSKTTIPEINREAWASLARLSANLNQTQAAINAGKAVAHPPGLLESIQKEVRATRLLLIGGSE